MAKPMLVTMPFVFWLLDFWPFRRFSFTSKIDKGQFGMRRIVMEKVPFFLLSAAASALTLWSRKSDGAAVAAIEFPKFAGRVATALVSYLRYVEKMIWPTNLAVGYPQEIPPAWEIVVALAFLAFLTILVIRLRSSHSYLAVGWFWYLGTLVPVIGLVHIGAQSMADRFTYVPLVGLFLMLTWSAADGFRSSRARIIIGSVAVVILGLCIGLTRAQVAHWKNSETLAEHGLRSTKRNHSMLTLLGVVRNEQGRFDEAISLFSDSLEINPDSVSLRQCATRNRQSR
jgi:protein O-mannosyl-transferase